MQRRALVLALLLLVPLALAAGDGADTDRAGATDTPWPGPTDAPPTGQVAATAHLAGSWADAAGGRDRADGAAPTAWVWSGNDAATQHAALERLGLFWHAYEHLEMTAFIADGRTARLLAEAYGGHVTAAETFDVHLDSSVPMIEADRVQEAVGNQRNGPTVLVVDTGVDALHPDFQDSLAANVAAERFGGLVVGTLIPDVVVDQSGHGTHVAGIVGGTGEATGPVDPAHGRYVGVYGNGRIAGFQASTDDGEAQVDSLAALEAFDWALANQDTYNVRVVVNSWGLPGDLNPRNPINEATLRLYLAGINVVFSAGNLGNLDSTVQLNKFCQSPWVLCVAAGGPDRGVLSLSSRGAPGGEPYAHPDITAPGWRITAADSLAELDAEGSILPVLSGAPTETLYVQRAGTSMAAPHVAGTAALLLAANPDLSPDQVMDVMTATADTMAEPVREAGAGYLNAREAYNLAVQTDGNREAFLAGDAVKYGGPRTGDPDYSDDPVSIGYTGTPRGGARLLDAPQDSWIGAGSIPFWVFVALGLLAAIVGTGLRRR